MIKRIKDFSKTEYFGMRVNLHAHRDRDGNPKVGVILGSATYQIENTKNQRKYLEQMLVVDLGSHLVRVPLESDEWSI